jgi:hypothetical protein
MSCSCCPLLHLKAWLNTSKDGKVSDTKKLIIISLLINITYLQSPKPLCWYCRISLHCNQRQRRLPSPLQEEEHSTAILRVVTLTSITMLRTALATPKEHTPTPTLLALPGKPPLLWHCQICSSHHCLCARAWLVGGGQNEGTCSADFCLFAPMKHTNVACAISVGAYHTTISCCPSACGMGVVGCTFHSVEAVFLQD